MGRCASPLCAAGGKTLYVVELSRAGLGKVGQRAAARPCLGKRKPQAAPRWRPRLTREPRLGASFRSCAGVGPIPTVIDAAATAPPAKSLFSCESYQDVSRGKKHRGTIDGLGKSAFARRGGIRSGIWPKRKIAIGLIFSAVCFLIGARVADLVLSHEGCFRKIFALPETRPRRQNRAFGPGRA